MTRFDDFDRTVLLFMQDFGFTATYVKTVSTTVNDTTGVITPTVQNIKVQAIKSELIKPRDGSIGSSPNTQIQDGDQLLYVRPVEKSNVFATAISVHPEADKIKINNELWKIVTVKQYDPSASDCILYEFYIRK